MTAKRKAVPSIYQIKVTLRGSKPPIWRRIQVASDTTLAKLHRILQVVMGWQDAHLHQFIVNDTYYGQLEHLGSDLFPGLETKNEKKAKLEQVAPWEKAKFIYEYDFGDSWEHELLVEKILSPVEGQHYPVCLKGKRACPPEDVGGVWGYADFLEALQDPEHPDHEDLREWIGGSFDPEAFDLEEINQRLQRIR